MLKDLLENEIKIEFENIERLIIQAGELRDNITVKERSFIEIRAAGRFR